MTNSDAILVQLINQTNLHIRLRLSIKSMNGYKNLTFLYFLYFGQCIFGSPNRKPIASKSFILENMGLTVINKHWAFGLTKSSLKHFF